MGNCPSGGILLCNSENANGDSAIRTILGRCTSGNLHVVRVAGDSVPSLAVVHRRLTSYPVGFVVFVSSLCFSSRSSSFNRLGTTLRNDLNNEGRGAVVCTASGEHRLVGRDLSSHRGSVGEGSVVRRRLDLSSEFNLSIAFIGPSGGSCLSVITGVTTSEGLTISRSELFLITRR